MFIHGSQVLRLQRRLCGSVAGKELHAPSMLRTQALYLQQNPFCRGQLHVLIAAGLLEESLGKLLPPPPKQAAHLSCQAAVWGLGGEAAGRLGRTNLRIGESRDCGICLVSLAPAPVPTLLLIKCFSPTSPSSDIRRKTTDWEEELLFIPQRHPQPKLILGHQRIGSRRDCLGARATGAFCGGLLLCQRKEMCGLQKENKMITQPLRNKGVHRALSAQVQEV